MAGSFAPRVVTEPHDPRPPERPAGSPAVGAVLRAVVVEGAAAVLLTLVCFAGFLALLAVVFPAGQDLRVLLQSERQGTGPNRLVARQGDRSGAGPATGVIASLKLVRPSVRKRLGGAIAWIHAETGSDFRSGDGIQTGASGRALLELGTSQIRLESNSLVILGVEAEHSSGLVPRNAAVNGFMVLRGEVAARVGGAGDGPLAIALPTGIVTARGGGGTRAEIVVTVDQDRAATLTALQGVLSLESRGQRMDLGPRQFTRVDRNGGLSEALPIPESPVLEAPPGGATYPFLDLPPKVRFAWQPAEGQAEWRLVVARDSLFDDAVVDERATTNSLTWGRLEPGRYHWHVIRLEAGVPSAPSPSRRLEVSRESRPLTLVVEPTPARVEGLRCVVRGRTVPHATVYVKGQQAEVRADGTFSAEVTLEPGANIVLVEAVAGGGQNVHSTHVIHAKP